MKLTGISKLGDVRSRSKILGDCGLFVGPQEAFFFLKDICVSKVYINVDTVDSDDGALLGTTYFESFAALKQVVDLFGDEVEVRASRNQMEFVSPTRTFSVTVKGQDKKPPEFAHPVGVYNPVGPVTAEVVSVAKVRVPAAMVSKPGDKNATEESLVFCGSSVYKVAPNYLVIYRIPHERWNPKLFSESVPEHLFSIDSELVEHFEDGEMEYLSGWVHLKKQTVSVYVPAKPPSCKIAADVVLQNAKKAAKGHVFAVDRERLVGISDLANRIYGSSVVSVTLDFESSPGGFVVVAYDPNSSIRENLPAVHDMPSGVKFSITGKALSQMKHFDIDSVRVRLSRNDGKGSQMTLMTCHDTENIDNANIVFVFPLLIPKANRSK